MTLFSNNHLVKFGLRVIPQIKNSKNFDFEIKFLLIEEFNSSVDGTNLCKTASSIILCNQKDLLCFNY